MTPGSALPPKNPGTAAPAWRSAVLLTFCLVAMAATCSAGTFNGTLTTSTTSLTWNSNQTGVAGQTQTGTGVANPPCNATICDLYNLTVNVPGTFYAAHPDFTITVTATWSSSLDEFDVYVYDASSNLVGMATQSGTTFNDADLGQLPSGSYQIQIVPTVAVQTSYAGTVTLAAEPSISSGRARYRQGNATFSAQKMTRPPGVYNSGPAGTVFFEQDAEPRIVHDPVGNLYLTAIQGVPSGSDTWKSMDGGNTWSYLGEPDGAQAAASGLGFVGAGAGGGDEDIIALPNGNIVLTSLWLGGNTTCTSSNGGAVWACDPEGSTLPADDRQWLANFDAKVVYITSKQLGADLSGTASIYVAKSTNGGVTFPFVSQVTTPELGVQPAEQGNILVDHNNGSVYTVFFGALHNQLYLAKSVDAGQTWMLKLAYQAPDNVSIAHVFPSLALDHAGNLYIAFSDGATSFLIHSTDGGESWSTPVRVNAGANAKTTVEPWVVAGDAGRVAVFFYGTSDPSFNSSSAHWSIYMAQSQNALTGAPTFAITAATGVMHIGAICDNGLGCANGTRNLLEYFYPDVYPDGSVFVPYPDDLHVNSATTTTNVWVLKQTGGPKLIGK
ncbi:MAG TPA: sialidase family protein [Candidatus Angelobacter sp.]